MKKLELIPSQLLPHRAPMLLIDEVLHTDFESTVIAKTTVKKDNFFFQGHFENYPLLPGVVMIEMMFQACGILNRITSMSKSDVPTIQNKIGKAVKINEATFFKEVFPDTTLIIQTKRIRNLLKFSEYKAIVLNEDGQKVCEAELIVTI